jgi:hypothetical protein
VLRRARLRLRTVLIAVAGLSLVIAYVGSYERLKQRGLREAADYGYPGFLYVHIEEAGAARDLSCHLAWARFFEPLNFLDRNVLSGPTHWVSFLWRLSDAPASRLDVPVCTDTSS